MLVLRIAQAGSGPDEHMVQLLLEGEGVQAFATSRFRFSLSPQDQEDIRWYLEDYLEAPFDPGPVIAARVERRLTQIGEDLFLKLFPAGSEARALWDRLRNRLGEHRVELAAEMAEGAAIPWELLKEPGAEAPVALRASELVRILPGNTVPPHRPEPGDRDLRVLLVICRPGGGADVPFRSVARHLVQPDRGEGRPYRLEVLRPPTMAQLERVLGSASDRGEPYHVVHFDGHGVYEAARPGGGARGYLVFEDPRAHGNRERVDGARLGGLLAGAGVPMLVLNACRSAHLDVADQPQRVGEPGAAEAQDRVRAYGSLAHEVVAAGVPGVVAMRYNVYVVTAARFVRDLYGALLSGQSLGGAVTIGRRRLATAPERDVGYIPRPLQDWTVPVVYELGRLTVSRGGLDQRREATSAQGDPSQRPTPLDAVGLPSDSGGVIFGRDETLLMLDRSFDNHRVVLLHGAAGLGKTTAAVEFARWYRQTGGVDGPVLFTSFEHYRAFGRVLDQVVDLPSRSGTSSGPDQASLTDAQRRGWALRRLREIPVLWIWDNVEPIAGYPTGSPTAWSEDERRELRDFLRALTETQARVLLTSRRDELAWLGDLPARVALPPMPMGDRVGLARELAKRAGRDLGNPSAWRPLLRFTQGNPLTLQVVVTQALRDGLATRDRLSEFAARLQEGAVTMEGGQGEGRSASLAASLHYGLRHGFTERQREQLALLCLFRGSVNAAVLSALWSSVATGSVERAIAGFGHAEVGEGLTLLARAAESGIVTSIGNGNYSVHPAVPWYFQQVATRPHDGGTPGRPELAERMYVALYAGLASVLFETLLAGDRSSVPFLAVEEPNFLHAHGLARAAGDIRRLFQLTRTLVWFYDQAARRHEIRRLLEDTLAGLLDPHSMEPLAGTAYQQQEIIMWAVALAAEFDERETAERLLVPVVQRERTEAEAAENDEIAALRRQLLASHLSALGDMQRSQHKAECIGHYQEALALLEQSPYGPLQQLLTLSLSKAYVEIDAAKDLVAAERWGLRSLALCAEDDVRARAACMTQLGSVHWRRFVDADQRGEPRTVSASHLGPFIELCLEALRLLPPDAPEERASVHRWLGDGFGYVGEGAMALQHFREAIRLLTESGRPYEVAKTRGRAAINLRRLAELQHAARGDARANFEDARAFAEAARADFQRLRMDHDVASATQLIAEIDAALG
jgi:CHAT domain-containing protein